MFQTVHQRDRAQLPILSLSFWTLPSGWSRLGWNNGVTYPSPNQISQAYAYVYVQCVCPGVFSYVYSVIQRWLQVCACMRVHECVPIHMAHLCICPHMLLWKLAEVPKQSYHRDLSSVNISGLLFTESSGLLHLSKHQLLIWKVGIWMTPLPLCCCRIKDSQHITCLGKALLPSHISVKRAVISTSPLDTSCMSDNM